jgi:hypothetical protein
MSTQEGRDSIEQERLELERERLDFDRDRLGFEAQLAFAHNGIKHLILINGAAVIALLAFLGHDNAVGGGAASVRKLAHAMIWFGSGVAAGAVSELLAYIFQTVEREAHHRIRLRVLLRVFAIGAAIAGVVCFVIGSLIAACAFSSV